MRVPGVRLATPNLTGRTARPSDRLLVSITRNAVFSACFAGALVVLSIRLSHAVDGVAIESGQDHRTDMWRVGAQWQWSQRWLQGEQWHVGGFWDLGLAQWQQDVPGTRSRLWEIGLTPVFRLQANDLRGVYLEAGIGAHLLEATSLGNKHFGSAFQFGDHIGFGYRFGARGEFDLSYRYQHLSNAGIKLPNSGLDSNQVRLQYWFR